MKTKQSTTLLILLILLLQMSSCAHYEDRSPASSGPMKLAIEEKIFQEYGLKFKKLESGNYELPTPEQYEVFLNNLYQEMSDKKMPKLFYPSLFEVGGIPEKTLGLRIGVYYKGLVHPLVNHHNPKNVVKQLMKDLKVENSPEAVAFEKRDQALTNLIISTIYEIEHKGYQVLSSNTPNYLENWVRKDKIENSNFIIPDKENFLNKLMLVESSLEQFDQLGFKSYGRIYLDFQNNYRLFHNHLRPIHVSLYELNHYGVKISKKDEKALLAKKELLIKKHIDENIGYNVKVANIYLDPKYSDVNYLKSLSDPDPALFSCSEEGSWTPPKTSATEKLGTGVAAGAALGAAAMTPGILIVGPVLLITGAKMAKDAHDREKTRKLMADSQNGQGETLEKFTLEVSKKLNREEDIALVSERIRNWDKSRTLCFNREALTNDSAIDYHKVVNYYVKEYSTAP